MELDRKTKIVCTIGPATNTEEMIEKLILAGMNVARLNFSHGNHKEHQEVIEIIRKVSKKLNTHVGILADMKGPEIRTGTFQNGSYTYERDDVIKIFKKDVIGNEEGFHINVKELFHDLSIGNTILIDDGKIKLTVLEVREDYLVCKVMNKGIIKNHKGVNTPGVHISMPFVSKKDSQDLTFAVEMNVDMIALSFVRTAQDVLQIRSILNFLDGNYIELISKIESQQAMDELENILKASDGIMVARGDLGVEVSTQAVPLYQKRMIAKANEMGRPVITATHMLESMVHTPRPTRAEASDVANAILDGSDAIMLSGETATGLYPIEAVKTMDIIAKTIEPTIDFENRLQKSILTSEKTVNDAIGMSVAQQALLLDDVKAVFAFTETGGTAKRLCKFRPSVPLIAITKELKTCHKLSYYWGVTSVFRDDYSDFVSYDRVAVDVAKQIGYQNGDKIIITSGYLQQHGSTNTIRIIEIK
ncbi:MAG: pyruvate kinase [Acholeplasmatales bacterium]|jgi:pyruvate kinase|nr:pyruvate kinase [Acholeplasmatales bacterium]